MSRIFSSWLIRSNRSVWFCLMFYRGPCFTSFIVSSKSSSRYNVLSVLALHHLQHLVRDDVWALYSFFARVHVFPEHAAQFPLCFGSSCLGFIEIAQGAHFATSPVFALPQRDGATHHLFPGVIVHGGGCVSLPSPASTWFSLTDSRVLWAQIVFDLFPIKNVDANFEQTIVTEMPSEVLRAPNKSYAAWRRETLACVSATRTSGLFPGSACTSVDGEELSFATLLFGAAGWTFVGRAFEGEVGVVTE